MRFTQITQFNIETLYLYVHTYLPPALVFLFDNVHNTSLKTMYSWQVLNIQI